MKEKEVIDFICIENAETIRLMCDRAYHLHDDECNQKYDDSPYSFHLGMVARIAIEHLYLVCEKEEDILPIIFAAYFHDAIEDARQTYNDILKNAKMYMTDDQALMAAEIVYALTDEKGRTRQERASDKHFEDIRNTKYAPFVKWCDRYANAEYSVKKKSRMVKVYRNEMSKFVALLGGDKYLTHELCDKILDLVKEEE